MVRSLPSNAEEVGSIPGRGTKIPHAVGQLSLRATTTEPAGSGACATTREKPVHCNEEPACCNKHPACHN